MKTKISFVLVLTTVLLLSVAIAQAAGPTGAIFTTTPNGSIVNENVRYNFKTEVYLDGGPGPDASQTAAGLDDGWYVFQVTDPSGGVLLSMDPAKCRVLEVKNGIIVRLVKPSEFGLSDGYTDQAGNSVPACHTQDSPDGVAGPSGRHDTNTDIDYGAYGAIVVQLMPFLDTPNPGGEYKAWVTYFATYKSRGGDLTNVPGDKANEIVKKKGVFLGYVKDPGFGPPRSDQKTDNFKVKEVMPPAPPVCGYQPLTADLTIDSMKVVGQIHIWVDKVYIYVQYADSADWPLKETYLEISTTLAGIPQENGNPLPHQFTYQTIHQPPVREFTYQIPLTEEWKQAKELYIAAYAILNRGYDAWACSNDFPGTDLAKYCKLPREVTKAFEFTIGYEDLLRGMTGNFTPDFDYNDFVLQVDGDMAYCDLGNGQMGLASVDYEITPKARGAAWNHEFHMQFIAGIFPSNGTSSVSLFDVNGMEIGFPDVQPFLTNQDNDLLILKCSCDAFPKQSDINFATNTVEGQQTTLFLPPQQTARLTINFDQVLPFDLSKYPLDDPGNVHGALLYFNPYIIVNPSVQPPVPYDISQGSENLLLIPQLGWAWPEEEKRIWTVYPNVIEGPPILFPANWWLFHNNCVYDGIPCTP